MNKRSRYVFGLAGSLAAVAILLVLLVLNRKDPIQGTWEMISAEGKGQTINTFKDFKVVFSGNKVTFLTPGHEQQNTFRQDPNKQPKQLDITLLTGPDANKTSHAIYKLEEDELVICINFVPGGDRPEEFATSVDTSHILWTLKRTGP
jgi:uncharacterized protein (TIGR03067 family)